MKCLHKFQHQIKISRIYPQGHHINQSMDMWIDCYIFGFGLKYGYNHQVHNCYTSFYLEKGQLFFFFLQKIVWWYIFKLSKKYQRSFKL
jgi:hypothetical protein